MLSETLTIPHPNKQRPEEDNRLLHEALGLEAVAQRLEVLADQSPETYDKEIHHQAQTISQAVSKSLWFEYNPDAPLPITDEQLEKHQTTSCFGYAICASECMEKAGIEHWVAFANNHAFLLVPKRSNDATILINPTNPALDGEIPAHQLQITPSAIDNAIGENDRGFVWFSADAYAKYSKNKDFLELVSLHLGGWLTTESEEALSAQMHDSGRGTLSKAPSKIAQERRLAVAVYTPQIGRNIMQQFGLFQHYVGKGDADAAVEQIRALGSMYPEIDSRSSQHHLVQLLDQLTTAGRQDTAKDTVNLVYGSLKETKDPRADILRADLIRRIGRHAQDSVLLSEADNLYATAERHTNKDLIARKRQKVANTIKNLGLARKVAEAR